MSSVVNALPGVPDVESPLFESIFKSKNLPSETVGIARKLREDGFAVIDFPEPEFNGVAETIIRTLDHRYDWNAWRTGKTPNLRIQDAWETVPEVKQVASNAMVLKLLSDLYGRRAIPFQTLNFPVGTQQHFHSDSVHFSCCPERFMAGVWVALEDIDADNGPLIYYPGSHKLPIFTNEHIGENPDFDANPYSHYLLYEKAWEAIVEALDLKPLYFHAKRGQALIWAANLLHGGAAQRDLNRTRYSQVTHYYFEGCCYYTPILSVPFSGAIYYRRIRDISNSQRVPNLVNGIEVPPTDEQRSYADLGQQLRRWPHPAGRKTSPHNAIPEHSKDELKLPPGFDPDSYLKANPDVAAAGVDPAQHWIHFGHREGRALR
ncbi:MAG: phytanoyl-CoA dioxygenase family protein [Acidobacteriaceae bacterium]|nr:phytanoyl-CoA dioxygenase family protein [Acidobacteriaceae bacterium]MBV9780021.1 phytanoyl-CoA dioxygenase family protein [Acidobacteriaceae bacterium]